MWTCWGLRSFFYDFLEQASSLVWSTASVRSAIFGRDLLLLLLNPYHIISTVTALQASAQPEVTCLFCVLRDEHLSIDRPVCPFLSSPTAAAGFVCYTSSHHNIT